MIHDCIYQFLRIFYHSRFKPQQLEMTTTQFLVPVFDLILSLPLVMRLFKDFSRFSKATKMKIKSKPEINGQSLMSFCVLVLLWFACDKLTSVWTSEDLLFNFLLFSHIYLSSIACLTEPGGKVRLAILYQAKMYRKTLFSELKARSAQNITSIGSFWTGETSATGLSELRLGKKNGALIPGPTAKCILISFLALLSPSFRANWSKSDQGSTYRSRLSLGPGGAVRRKILKY